MQKKLETIQKREKLNDVYMETHEGTNNHDYVIKIAGSNEEICAIHFQDGPRHNPNSRHGVIDTDLLEIVRDRLEAFQKGKFKSHYNEEALFYVEKALESLNNRVEDRINRNVLGTNNK